MPKRPIFIQCMGKLHVHLYKKKRVKMHIRIACLHNKYDRSSLSSYIIHIVESPRKTHLDIIIINEKQKYMVC